MNLMLFYIGFVVAATTGCNQQHTKQKVQEQERSTVILQPLKFADTSALQLLKTSIEEIYPVAITIAANKQLPEDLFYKPRKRHRADRIIHWLRVNKPDSVRTIVGVTAVDISSTKNNVYDYGVMGLGYQPGHACVVSTFRPAKTAKSKTHLQERLLKLVLHEMGHNFGLPHCTDEQCFMVDAEGQMKLDKERYLCANCRRQLKL